MYNIVHVVQFFEKGNKIGLYVCVVANVESGLELSQLNSSPQV